MKALKNFVFDNYEFVTLVVVVVLAVGIFISWIYFANMVAETEKGKGFRRGFAMQIIAYSLGLITMYLWIRFM